MGQELSFRRPALKPALRRAWRDRSTLQLGVDPDRAVILGGLADPVAEWLEHLDGTRDRDGVLAAAKARGLEPPVVARLLDLLTTAGALEDAAADRKPLRDLSLVERQRLAPDLAALSVRRETLDGGAATLARRRSAAVAIVGAGRIGASVTALLASAGIGYLVVRDARQVRPGDLAPAGASYDQLGRRRDTATIRAARRASPAFRASLPPGRRHPDLAVLAPTGPLDTDLRDRLARAGVPHLFAGVRDLAGVVGPLVLPGRTSCLHCHDLHRTDRDRAWPRVAAQFAAAERGRQAARLPRPGDIVLATLVAAYTAANALSFVDGESPPAVDGTLEIETASCCVRRRSWVAHPACPCGAGAAAFG